MNPFTKDFSMHRLIFLGTSDFAVPSLRSLLDDPRFEVAAVITQPDRPVGRHATLTPPPLKKFLLENTAHRSIPLFQPEKIKELQTDECFQNLLSPQLDAFVVVSYGKILPQWFLDLSKMGIVNVHGSVLPRWRGASPIQAAIAAGDPVSGVTIMKIDAEMDHGPILAIAEESILEIDTGSTLHDRLAALGGKILPDILADYLDLKIRPSEQDHQRATSCKILSRDDGKIDWTKTSEEIERLVRAYNPWPGTWTEIEEKRLKILAARLGSIPSSTMDGSGRPMPTSPGEFFIHNKRPFIICGGGTSLEIVAAQPEGKKPMSGEELARGLKNRL